MSSTMRTSNKENLWSITVFEGRAKVLRNGVPLRSKIGNQSEREYGFLTGVSSCEPKGSAKKMIQVISFFGRLSLVTL